MKMSSKKIHMKHKICEIQISEECSLTMQGKTLLQMSSALQASQITNGTATNHITQILSNIGNCRAGAARKSRLKIALIKVSLIALMGIRHSFFFFLNTLGVCLILWNGLK
jgi:hypothetical protein